MNVENAPHFANDLRPGRYLKPLREDKASVSLVESVVFFPQKLEKDINSTMIYIILTIKITINVTIYKLD